MKKNAMIALVGPDENITYVSFKKLTIGDYVSFAFIVMLDKGAWRHQGSFSAGCLRFAKSASSFCCIFVWRSKMWFFWIVSELRFEVTFYLLDSSHLQYYDLLFRTEGFKEKIVISSSKRFHLQGRSIMAGQTSPSGLGVSNAKMCGINQYRGWLRHLQGSKDWLIFSSSEWDIKGKF